MLLSKLDNLCFMLLTSNPFDAVKNEINNEDNIIENDLTQKITEVGATGYSVITKVGLYIGLISLVVCGIGFLFANGQVRDEKKKDLVMKVLGIILIVGAVGLVGAISSFAAGLFSGN